jgi:hypothetical protein
MNNILLLGCLKDIAFIYGLILALLDEAVSSKLVMNRRMVG